MYRDVARLLMYSDLGEDSILLRLSEILRDWELRPGGADPADLPGDQAAFGAWHRLRV